MADCIFCKIAEKEILTELIFENNSVLAFNDIRPLAPIHILIIPKKHIESISDLTKDDKLIISDIIFAAKEIAENKKLKGYKLIFNVGKEAGQTINHIHLHLLAGRISKMP